jgi:hypothetical protein
MGTMSESRDNQAYMARLLPLSLSVIVAAGVIAGPVNASGHTACESSIEQVVVSGVTHTVETISKVGTCTWAVPANVSSVDIRLVGGGGGGGGGDSTVNGRSGGGGGAGGFVSDALEVKVAAGATINFAVGAAGAFGVGSSADGTLATNGAVGGNSSFAVSSPVLFGFASGGTGGIAASRGAGKAGIAGDGGNYDATLSGGLGKLRQGGSGGSSLSTGSLSPDVNVGFSYTGFSLSPRVLSSGGGGGDLAQFGATGAEPGSGGGGGRGSLATVTENAGFDGFAGRDGLVMVRYVVKPTTPAPAPEVPTVVPVDLVVDSAGTAGSSAKATGSNLNTLTQIKVGGVVVGFEVVGSSVIFSLPNLATGNYSVEFYTGVDKLLLKSSIQIVGSSVTNSAKKVNAGSFKGFVAIYASGYEGQRLSAKVGNDWVVVPRITNNQQNGGLFRVVEFTGAGYTLNVPIYIDRVLIETITVTTK